MQRVHRPSDIVGIVTLASKRLRPESTPLPVAAFTCCDASQLWPIDTAFRCAQSLTACTLDARELIVSRTGSGEPQVCPQVLKQTQRVSMIAVDRQYKSFDDASHLARVRSSIGGERPIAPSLRACCNKARSRWLLPHCAGSKGSAHGT